MSKLAELHISKIYCLSSTPDNPIPNRFWFDTTNEILKRYNESTSTWVPIKINGSSIVNADQIILNIGNNQTATLANILNGSNGAILDIGETLETLQSNLTNNTYNFIQNHSSTSGTSEVYNSNVSLLNSNGTKISLTGNTGIEITNAYGYSGSGITTVINSTNALDSKLPTAKAVYDKITDIQNILNSPNEIVTSAWTSTSINFEQIISDSSYANKSGKITIQPKLGNVSPIYVGQSVSSKTNAFPLYPDQIVTLSFTDITTFKFAADAIGDGANYIIEWGNVEIIQREDVGIILVGTDGTKYKVVPSGDSGSETLNVTRLNSYITDNVNGGIIVVGSDGESEYSITPTGTLGQEQLIITKL